MRNDVFGYDDGFERDTWEQIDPVECKMVSAGCFDFENIQQGPEWCSTLSVDRGVWGRVSGYLSKNASRKFEERVFGYDDGFERDTREQIDLAECENGFSWMFWFENMSERTEWCSTLSVDRGVWGRVCGYLGKNASQIWGTRFRIWWWFLTENKRVFGYDDAVLNEIPENKRVPDMMMVLNELPETDDFRWMFWFEKIQQGPEWCSTLSVDRGVWGRVTGYLSKNASRKFEERVFGYDDGFERDTREQIDPVELKMVLAGCFDLKTSSKVKNDTVLWV